MLLDGTIRGTKIASGNFIVWLVTIHMHNKYVLTWTIRISVDTR